MSDKLKYALAGSVATLSGLIILRIVIELLYRGL